MKKLAGVIILFLSFFLNGTAQQDLTLYELKAAPQSHALSPSKIPLCKGYLLLPGISGAYTSINSEGFTYADAFKLNDDGTIDIKLNDAIDKMKDLNNISFDFKVPVLGLGFRMGAGFASFGIESKGSSRFTIPKTLAEFIWLGNADEKFLGKRANFDGLGVDFMQYTEFALGFARDFDEKWTFGIKAKYLSGNAFLRTTESSLGITTDAENYAIALDGQIQIQAAGVTGLVVDSLLNFNGFNFENINDQLITAGTGNHGGAIDLGATFRLNEKISFNASVLDLGLINWAASAVTKTSKPISYVYDGISVTDLSSGTGEAENIVGTLDTLFKSIQFDDKQESFTTTLPVKIYAGGNYRILPKTDLSLITYNELYNGRFKTSIRLGATQRIRNFLMATINYSVYGNSAANLGAGFTLNAGPVQLYTATDNVLAFMLPEKSKNFHLRFGINLTFGNNFSQN